MRLSWRLTFKWLCGILDVISAQKCFKDIAWEKYKNFLHFQYSLHFTNDSDRYKFLYPQLMEISEAIGNFNRICTILNDTYKINYIPFDTLNDNDKSIKELIIIMNTAKNAVLKISTMCEINGSSLLPTKSFEAFSTKVKNSIENVEIFNSDGVDINAGCGQFYNESITWPRTKECSFHLYTVSVVLQQLSMALFQLLNGMHYFEIINREQFHYHDATLRC